MTILEIILTNILIAIIFFAWGFIFCVSIEMKMHKVKINPTKDVEEFLTKIIKSEN